MIRICLPVILVLAIVISVPSSTALARPMPEQAPQEDFRETQAPQRQGPPQVEVQGEISGGSLLLKSSTIELRPFYGGTPQTTMPREDGTFHFYGVIPGQYEIRVSDIKNGTLYAEVVSLRLDVERIDIRVPDNPAPHSDSAIVSVQQCGTKFQARP